MLGPLIAPSEHASQGSGSACSRCRVITRWTACSYAEDLVQLCFTPQKQPFPSIRVKRQRDSCRGTGPHLATPTAGRGVEGVWEFLHVCSCGQNTLLAPGTVSKAVGSQGFGDGTRCFGMHGVKPSLKRAKPTWEALSMAPVYSQVGHTVTNLDLNKRISSSGVVGQGPFSCLQAHLLVPVLFC